MSMKKILLILLILMVTTSIFAAEIFFGISLPVKINSNNISIQNGPTPNLQKEIIEERVIPEGKLMEELETELIEIRATNICA